MDRIVQKIEKKFTPIETACNYYYILCKLNDLHLTQREIQLLAFTAIRGGITNPAAKQDFCSQFNSTTARINNIISKLSRMGIFIKKGNKLSINPAIYLDFNKELILQINFK